jgi:hypothetical protein
VALVILLAGVGAFLYHQTVGTVFWFDEWQWILHRRGGALSGFLDPHNQHLSLVPVAIYKFLFATAGIGSYAPYRVLVDLCHLAVCALLFIYARRRVGPWPALVVAALLLLLGPAWQNFLWPFQTAWLISLGCGIGALLMLDRGDRRGDVAACLLTAVSLASSGLGLPVALGVAADIAFGRRRVGAAWIVAIPLAFYAIWWIAYQQAGLTKDGLLGALGFVAAEAASALAALAGLAGQTAPSGQGTLLQWGAPLLVAALAILCWRLARIGRIPPRVIALITIVLSFWILTAISRAELHTPYSSRYIYVGALLILLLGVELARGWSPGSLGSAALAIIALAVLASNVGALRDGARVLRTYGQATAADLGALEIGRPLVRPGYILGNIPGYPFLMVRASDFFSAARALGDPAASPTIIAGDQENVRTAADAELIRIHGIYMQPAGPSAIGATPVVVDSTAGTSTSAVHGCRRFAPLPFAGVLTLDQVSLTVPRSGLLVRTGATPTRVGLRRFGDAFRPLGTLAADAAARLRIAPDLSPRPWHMQFLLTGPLTACALS